MTLPTTSLLRRLTAPMSRRTGFVALVGFAAGAFGLSDIDAKKKKKKKKPITVCANARTCKYTSLQAAIDGSPAGSTICLKGGEYSESVSITKSLTIRPCSADAPVTIVAIQNQTLLNAFFENSLDELIVDGLTPGGLTLRGNGDVFRGGGVIGFCGENLATSAGTLTLRHLTVSNGSCSSGGGIYADTSGTVHLTDTVIEDCRASTTGGGITHLFGTLTLDGASQVRACTAPSSGGVFLYQSATMNLKDTATIGGATVADGNSATDPSDGNGGGIGLVGPSQLTMDAGAMVMNNTANNNGGGIYAAETSVLNGSATCTNTTKIADNTLGTGGGVGPQIYHVNHATC